jgi:hypothetical protein
MRTHYPQYHTFKLIFHQSGNTHTAVISFNIKPEICAVIWAVTGGDHLGLFAGKSLVANFLIPVQESHES